MTTKAWDGSVMKTWDSTSLAGERGRQLAGLAERVTRGASPWGRSRGTIGVSQVLSEFRGAALKGTGFG